MAYSLDTIEDAMIAALDVSPINTYAKTIKTYSGQLAQDVNKVLLILPAILVVFGGDEFRSPIGANTVFNRVMDWDVLVAARNLRGDVGARHGVGSEVGVYEMLDDVRSKLVGQKLSLNIEPLRIVRRRPVLIDARAYIYALRFQTMCDYVQT